MTDDIHSCSYYCDRPECIKRQRDELRIQFDRLQTEILPAEIADLMNRLESMEKERNAWRKLVLEHNARCYWEESKILIPPALIDQP